MLATSTELQSRRKIFFVYLLFSTLTCCFICSCIKINCFYSSPEFKASSYFITLDFLASWCESCGIFMHLILCSNAHTFLFWKHLIPPSHSFNLYYAEHSLSALVLNCAITLCTAITPNIAVAASLSIININQTNPDFSHPICNPSVSNHFSLRDFIVNQTPSSPTLSSFSSFFCLKKTHLLPHQPGSILVHSSRWN